MKVERHKSYQIRDSGGKNPSHVTVRTESTAPNHIRLGDAFAGTSGHDHVWIHIDAVERVVAMMRKVAKQARKSKRAKRT